MAALKARAPLQTRVGIATGLVVVGELIGSGEAQERGIVGETTNLAARLQGIAKPNTVVIAEGTESSRQSVRTCGPRGQDSRASPGRHRPSRRCDRVRWRAASRRARDRPNRPRGAGRRTRIAAPALDEGQDRRRPGGAAVRRGRYRQIATHGGAAGKPRQRTAHALALFLLAAAHRQRVLSIIGQMERAAGFRTTTSRKRSSTSSTWCSRRLRLRSRMQRCLPRCCRYRMMDAIPSSN